MVNRSCEVLLERLLATPGRRARVTHVERLPPRPGRCVPWPAWVSPVVVERLRAAGVSEPWGHQVAAASQAWHGQSVITATGAASGKSLAYLLPALSAILQGGTASGEAPAGRGATVLYIAPTKALAADQLRVLHDLDVPGVRACPYDGDTPSEVRAWARAHASYVLTNPDMLHRALLPGHRSWSSFLRGLCYVVIDECHEYRGVFGSHVAQVIRRLRRLCAKYGSSPVFVLASATVSDAAHSASRLVGQPVVEVTDDGSPRGETAFVLWEPPLTERRGEQGAPLRRTVTAESAELLTDLVIDGVRTVAFIRSRRGSEAVALMSRQALGEAAPELAGRVAAYRAGYLPEERRAVERHLHSGELLGVAATNALELGIDVAGLDAVILAGYPGTRASMWQQVGRAGRAGQGALAVLVARDDPLDTFLAHHPEALFGRPVEATVLDPDNPYVLAPHLCAAAAETPLTLADEALFGPAMQRLLADLVKQGLLRRRPDGWFWIRRERACDLADIRGVGGRPVHVVEAETGRLLGTVDAGAAHATVHRGAVYLHQGETYLISALDLDESVAFATPADPDYATFARDVTDIRVIDTLASRTLGAGRLAFGTVEVTNHVVAFLRKRVATGEVLGEERLDLPPRHLRTRAVWWTVPGPQVAEAGVDWSALPGAAHAAEHASIGLLPLFATCDRWDIGGVSSAVHVDTGLPTVFVYDGQAGGAGFAQRGYQVAGEWLTATREAISSCGCSEGCPSCIQSPKCGNGNKPLDKAGAVRLLDALLRGVGVG
ncbi:MAG: DEAD/DEAH box helicase [Carbonactinosporaceae bacterium]